MPCPRCGQANRSPRTAAGSPRSARCHEPLPWLVAADVTDFAVAAEDAPLPVLVDLWAAWCRPSRMVALAVVRATGEFAGRLKVVKVDVDAAPSVAARYEARSIPRVGHVVGRQVGADRLLAWVGAPLTNHGAAAGR